MYVGSLVPNSVKSGQKLDFNYLGKPKEKNFENLRQLGNVGLAI